MRNGPFGAMRLPGSEWLIFLKDSIEKLSIWSYDAPKLRMVDSQWISMDFNGFHLIFYGFQLISMDFNGFQWISIDFNGFQWISIDLIVIQWIPFDINGIQSISVQ